MVYTPNDWKDVNDPNKTLITAEWLDHMEAGISDAHTMLASLQGVYDLVRALEPFPPSQWVHWGDSMVADSTSGWGPLWAAFDGQTHVDEGIGGQWPEHVVARQGARPPIVTVTGGTIPASGAVAVTVDSTREPLNADGSVLGTLAGIAGALTRSSDEWSFVRTCAGTATPAPAASTFTPTDALKYRGYRMVLEAANGAKYTTDPVTDFVEPMQAALDYNESFAQLVLDVAPSSDIPLPSTPGSAREKFDNTNTALAAAFPGQFFGLFAWMRTADAFTAAGAIPTAEDVDDITAGVTPGSWRKDGIHLNAMGARVAAYKIADEAYQRRYSHVGPTLTTATYTNLIAAPAPTETTALGWTGYGGADLPATNAAGAYVETPLAWSPTGDGIKLTGAVTATTVDHINITAGGAGTGALRSAVTPGVTYSGSMYVAAEKSLTVLLRIRFVDGSLATVGDVYSSAVTLPATPERSWISVTGVAPANSVYAMLSVIGSSGLISDGTWICAGGPMLVEGSVALPCHTGADEGWSWSGTAWQSKSSGPITAWVGA